MTLWANRDGQAVTIHGNIGLNVDVQDSRVAQYSISENAGHVRGFWSQLGKLLDEAEQEAKEAANDAGI